MAKKTSAKSKGEPRTTSSKKTTTKKAAGASAKASASEKPRTTRKAAPQRDPEPEGAPFAAGAGVGDELAVEATTESVHQGGTTPRGTTRKKASRRSEPKGIESDVLIENEESFERTFHHDAGAAPDENDVHADDAEGIAYDGHDDTDDFSDSTARAADEGEDASLELPFQGELIRAANKRHAETIVFVHHFGGSKRTVHRHIDLANKLGYDAVRFNLIFNDVKPMQRLPITASLKFGTRHIWTEQIESILNSIPGRKILYSFSMPSASVLDAIGRRQASDIAGWVCDGGPFLQLPRCVWNLYTHEYGVQSRLFRSAFTGISLFLFGFGFEHEVSTLLKRLPRSFPVLSIRGWKDPLVPPAAIDDVFNQQSHLDLETLALADGKHLDGLKFYADQYVPRVERFLSRL